MSLTLARALRFDTGCVAFAGSGGKTTAMFQLARQLPPPVVITATSHLGNWQASLADTHISEVNFSGNQSHLGGVTLITGASDGDRLNPVRENTLHQIWEFCTANSIPLLVEADGSRQKPLKAWAEHEPPIPAFATHIVQVVGLNGIGKLLSAEFVHRPEIFSKLSGVQLGNLVTPEAITRTLLHSEGARKNFPAGVRRMALLNQADSLELQAIAQGMADTLLAGFDSVVISSAEQKKVYAVHEHIAGIVLAAGESSRYGQPKQILDWQGEPFVRAVARKAINSGLSPVIVVLGSNAETILKSISDLDVTIVENKNWKSGQAGSIRAGVLSLTESQSPGYIRKTSAGAENTGGCIFLLVDQPQIPVSVINALREKHSDGLPPIVAPMVLDRRANPVLFDRITFEDLLTLDGDVGGRAIFHKYNIEYLPWHDDALLLDVDTPEQYQRLIADESL